jgi:hypothetical protein
MKSLVTFFGCGRIESDSLNSTVDFVVTRFSDITDNIIIPFFKKYNIISAAGWAPGEPGGGPQGFFSLY